MSLGEPWPVFRRAHPRPPYFSIAAAAQKRVEIFLARFGLTSVVGDRAELSEDARAKYGRRALRISKV
jgi:hypothetical protein